jgi:hypothetical protein
MKDEELKKNIELCFKAHSNMLSHFGSLNTAISDCMEELDPKSDKWDQLYCLKQRISVAHSVLLLD